MSSAKISMPHRHTVRYESDTAHLEYEVELLSNGIVLYASEIKVISGSGSAFESETHEVETWLSSKFDTVEVET